MADKLEVSRIEGVTDDLKAVQVKLDRLLAAPRLDPDRRKLLASLCDSLRGVRGDSLGQLRIAIGLDPDIAASNRAFAARAIRAPGAKP